MINNIEFLAFLRETLALSRTIVIKNENLALADNALMKAHYGLDSGDNKSRWRYYLNLNGEYHSTDTMMVVKSLDDNELIQFTKENLDQHPATKKAYRLGGYYFSRLNAEYPGQSELIQGIINPIPPEESLAAENFQILRYTKEYVLWNETQLIPELQEDIYKNVFQFYNTEYTATDNLMTPALIAVLEKCIYEFILQNRFENRKSRYAHTFFIWSHLQSNGISPIYKDLLNNKQTMWLFRNIDYVLRNLGKEKTFKELIDILLTERDIPLAKYDLVQSTEEMRETLQPEPLYYSERLNLIDKKGLDATLHKVSKIMLKEIPESLDNEINYDFFYGKTKEESAFGEYSHYPIKILESDLVDTTNRKPETIYNVLNNELIYMAGKGLYNINLDIEEPRTGVHQRISVKDAIVLWHCLLNKYHGADCDNIPKFYYKDVLRITPPKLSELLKTGSKPFITEAWCKDVLKTHIPQIRIVSPSLFYENSKAIFDLKWAHEKMFSRWCSIGYYSRRKNAIHAMYETGFMSLTSHKTYTSFLKQFEFDFTEYSKEDYFRLMWELWKKMTGWDQFTHITVAQIQSGMIGLMKFLSSYTVQYIYQTVMEEGWYEGGIDLFTENPMLLDPNTDGQLELETDTSRWIPVHHRVTTDEDQTVIFEENGRFEQGAVVEELTENGVILQTPLLYDYDPDDLDDNIHGAYNVDLTQKYREYTGPFPYDLDDLIPTGGERANDHTLKEMIVDKFEGVAVAGPWVATNIIVVNNGLDNKAVADNVDGFNYAKIIKIESFTKNAVVMRRYYIGFVPALLNSNVIKLDIIATNKETNELTHVRFDYNIKTKQNSWALSYEIPQSIALNVPFDITPTITGLALNDEVIVKEDYVLDSNVSPYLKVTYQEGKLKGEFIKANWPDKLPLSYQLLTKNKNNDELLSRHYYYMAGLIPSDRYYDPLTDPLFDPIAMYNEADSNAITLERFTVTKSNKGWEAVDLFIKKDSLGNVPTDKVKTHYNGIIDFLTPTLTERKYVDETINGKTTRTFEWLYAIAKENTRLTLVLELRASNGESVYKEFTYTPTVIDHQTLATYSVLPSADYAFNSESPTETSLSVKGLGSGFTLTGGLKPVRAPSSDTHVTLSILSSSKVVDNTTINGYIIDPTGAPEKTCSWGVKISGTVKTKNGKTMSLYPYGKVELSKDNFVDYDKLDASDFNITPWGDYPLYTHAVAGTRYSVNTLPNGWAVESVDLTPQRSGYPAGITDVIYDHLNAVAYSDIKPSVVIGNSMDGNNILPDEKGCWFTIKALGDRKTLAEGKSQLSLPIDVVARNQFTKKTKTFQFTVSPSVINLPFEQEGKTKNPTELNPSTVNHVIPAWKDLPFSLYGQVTTVSSEGLFPGLEKYTGGTGYKDKPSAVWNSDTNTADITLPNGPLTDGRGVRIFNKRICRATSKSLAGSSLQDVVYYPYIDYSKSEINRILAPTLADFDFTHLGNVDFYKGVRSSYVTLFNAQRIYDLGWKVLSLDLEVLGKDNEADHIITTLNGVNIKNNAYTVGTQNNDLHDMPAGKTKYASMYVGFIPAKEGKQTFTVVVTAAVYKITGIETKEYRYDIELDVKPQEGSIDYDSSYPDPWWLVEKETFVLTALNNISGSIRSKQMLIADINEKDGIYASVRAAVNAPLSGAKALAVTVKQSFSDITPEAVVGWSAFFNGYYNADPRSTRRYFGTLPIRADRLYRMEDINIGTMEFEPDIITNPMLSGVSYTERYIYNINTKGWTVTKMKVREEKEWMNHFLEYDNYSRTNAQLYSNGSYNQSKDKLQSAPTGKTFYLPTYGSRKVGEFDVYIDIVLSSKHHSSSTTVDITYESKRKVNESDITVSLDSTHLIIGEQTELGGKGLINLPTSDMHDAVKAYTSTITPIGSNYGYFKPFLSPIRVMTDKGYVGSGKGIMISISTSWTASIAGKTVESETWYRRFRGDVIIPEKDITISPAVFGFIPAYNQMMTGSICAVRFFVTRAKELAPTGWVVNTVGLKGAKDGTYNKSIIVGEAEGMTFSDLYTERRSSNKDWDVGTGKKDAFIVAFMLQHFTGEKIGGREDRSRKIEFILSATREGKDYEIPYTLSLGDVAAGTDPTFFLNQQNTLLGMSDVPGSYIKKSINFIRPFGANADKTSVNIVNEGIIDGKTENTAFTFTDVKNQNFRYAVKVIAETGTKKDPDSEIVQRGFVGVCKIDNT